MKKIVICILILLSACSNVQDDEPYISEINWGDSPDCPDSIYDVVWYPEYWQDQMGKLTITPTEFIWENVGTIPAKHYKTEDNNASYILDHSLGSEAQGYFKYVILSTIKKTENIIFHSCFLKIQYCETKERFEKSKYCRSSFYTPYPESDNK